MEPSFWAARWKEGRIGFHEGRPNALLERHVSRLGSSRRVLVPLCGKSDDLAFLAARGHQVLGVELVRDALVAFFDEHGLQPRISRRGAFEVFEAEGLTLLAGDFFSLTQAETGPLDALYDRAAIVALPQELRGRYVRQVRSLLAPDSTGLIITFDYPQEQMAGPPFSVPEPELRSHFAGAELELIEERSWTARAGAAGREVCFSLGL